MVMEAGLKIVKEMKCWMTVTQSICYYLPLHKRVQEMAAVKYCFFGGFDYEKEAGNWKSCGTDEIEVGTAWERRQEKKF